MCVKVKQTLHKKYHIFTYVMQKNIINRDAIKFLL